MELIDFNPGNNLSAIGLESGTQFGTRYVKKPIELVNGDWAGVDDVSDEAVSIL